MSLTLFPQKVLLRLQVEQPTTAKLASGTLTVSNSNEDLAMAFKIEKTSGANKGLLVVSPESGRIAPGQSILVAIRCNVSVHDVKIRVIEDFIVRSILIPLERQNLKMYDIWMSPDVNRRRVSISESSFVVVFDEDLDDLDSSPRQSISSECSAESREHSARHQSMQVGFSPCRVITFQRPLTRPIARSLIISNYNLYAIAFSLKTKTPEFYCTQPNFGKVEPGQNIHITIEHRPFLIEPPPSERCQHSFLVDIAAIGPEYEHLSVDNILKCTKESGGNNFYSHKLCVTYAAAEDLARGESTAYVAGMAPPIPGELISVYPEKALSFKLIVSRPSELKGKIVITNIHSGPIAFRVKVTAPEMYIVDPISGTIESGGCQRILVKRGHIKNVPLINETCQDVFCIETTWLDFGQECFDSDQVWAAVKREGKRVFRRKLPVSFIHFGSSTRKHQALEERNAQSGTNKDEQDVDAQKTSIHRWLLTVVPSQ